MTFAMNKMLICNLLPNSQDLVGQQAVCNKRSRGTKSAMLEGKLIIVPALGHQNKAKSSFTGSGLFV